MPPGKGLSEHPAKCLKRKFAEDEASSLTGIGEEHKMSPREISGMQLDFDVHLTPQSEPIVSDKVSSCFALGSSSPLPTLTLHAHPALLTQVIATYLDATIDENEHSPQVYDAQSVFHGYRPPSISTLAYLCRIEQLVGCSPVCFLVALRYLERLAEKHGPAFKVGVLNTPRLLIVAVLLAVKFCEDFFHDNAHFSRVGGLPVEELNRLELEMLSMLDFSLNICEDELAVLQLAMIEEVSAKPCRNSDELCRDLANAGLVLATKVFRS